MLAQGRHIKWTISQIPVLQNTLAETGKAVLH